MRWVGHVTRIGDRRGAYIVLVGDPRERDDLKDPGIDGLLKWILKIWVGESWTGLICLRIGASSGRLRMR